MFVPEGDSLYAELLGVYAHELTHHWLQARSPMARETTAARDYDLPGYWIGEGFATWVEELLLDPRRGTWDAKNPRASSLDTLVNAPKDLFLPWDQVLTMSYAQLTELSPQSTHSVPITWKLGVRAKRSPIQMFYAQAGAVCHYLYHAEGGRYRPALINYVGAWYRNDRSRLDIRRAFGMSPKNLGQRVERFAEKLLSDSLQR